MSFFAAGGGLAVIAGLGLRYIESRCEMDETQDAAPSGTQQGNVNTGQDLGMPAQEAGTTTAGESSSDAVSVAAEATGAASAVPASPELPNVDAGTAPGGAATPAIVEPSASQPSAEVAPLGESGAPAADASALGLSPEAIGSASPVTTTPAGDSTDSDPNAGAETAANPSSQQSADSGASTSDGDTGEQPAEEPKDSGTPSQSSSTVDPVQDVEFVESAGNAAGPVDSAATATSPEDALTAVVAVTAAAFSVDMLDKFETRKYPDGTIMRTVGALPETSPVSYPTPTAPAADTPHGLLNAIEEYFTTALRSSRTDGHKLIAQLRAALPQD